MKNLTCYFYFFLCSQFAFAQTTTSPPVTDPNSISFPKIGNRKIEGTVIDSTTLLPIEFANVALINNTSGKTVNGAASDEKGYFVMERLALGDYKLVVVFVGYKKTEIAHINITESKEIWNVGRISLTQAVQILKEVTVEGNKQLFEEKVDRMVYNAENDATNRGGDATDVLRKAPLVTVDMDGTVSLRGNTNIKVLINNRPSAISSSSIADALRQIPAEQIKSVEVITSPSAKYDAEGAAGIINIITKKNTMQGVAFRGDASSGIRSSTLALNGSYRRKKMGFTLGGSGRAMYNTPGDFYNHQTTATPTGQLTNVQLAATRNNRIVGQYTLGWDYDINKQNSISSSVKYSVQNNYTYQDQLSTQIYKNDTLTGMNTKNVDISSVSNTVDANFNYTRTFQKPKREYSLMLIYSRNNNDYNFTNNTLNNQNLSEIASRSQNKNNSYNQEATIQTDYQTPITSTQMLEVGLKEVARKVSSNYQYLYSTADEPSALILNPKLNNTFDYNQNISAGYFTYALTFLKTYNLKAGMRYENTMIQADFQKQQTVNINIPSYNVLVPSINVSKKLANGNTIKASFNRRIQRPNLQSLNPNLQASSALNVTVGNPNLRPEYANNYEVSYTINRNKSSFTCAAYMRNITGDIQVIRDIIGDTIRSTYQNLGIDNNYGLNLLSNINISNRFTLNGGLDIYYRVLKNNDPNPLYSAVNQGWSVGGRMSGSYVLGKGWGLQAFGFYRGQRVQLQGIQGGFGLYSLSIKKDLNKKKGSIGLGIENFFSPSIRVRSTVNSPVLDQASITTYHNMNIKVNFSYRIGKIKKTEEKPKYLSWVNPKRPFLL